MNPKRGSVSTVPTPGRCCRKQSSKISRLFHRFLFIFWFLAFCLLPLASSGLWNGSAGLAMVARGNGKLILRHPVRNGMECAARQMQLHLGGVATGVGMVSGGVEGEKLLSNRTNPSAPVSSRRQSQCKAHDGPRPGIAAARYPVRVRSLGRKLGPSVRPSGRSVRLSGSVEGAEGYNYTHSLPAHTGPNDDDDDEDVLGI